MLLVETSTHETIRLGDAPPQLRTVVDALVHGRLQMHWRHFTRLLRIKGMQSVRRRHVATAARLGKYCRIRYKLVTLRRRPCRGVQLYLCIVRVAQGGRVHGHITAHWGQPRRALPELTNQAQGVLTGGFAAWHNRQGVCRRWEC